MDDDQHGTGDFQIYLSSTLDDLREERAAAVEILRRHGLVKDSYRAGPEPVVSNCLADVRASQLYVIIIGKRYGWIPDGESDPEAKSITEMEYDSCASGASGPVPRLVFVRTTNPDRFSDSDTRPQTADRIRRFRERAQTDQQPYTFDTLPQFTIALSEAVMDAREAWKRSRVGARPNRRAALRVAPWSMGQTLRPLPGYPVLDGPDGPTLTGGGLVNIMLSHDHASAHTIVVTSLVAEWTYEPLGAESVQYAIDGGALAPQGLFTPERFTVVLAGHTLRSASWTTGQGAGTVKAIDGDLLNTDPPRQIQLDDRADDAISLQGVMRVTTPGRYAVRWRIGFIVSGELAVWTTAPVHLIQSE